MSAIAGIVRLDGAPADRANLDRMLERLAHRGTDGHGSHIGDSCGLGHRMLWTTPESLHERLPLTDPTGDLTLTADARIDNRDELISAFGLTAAATDGEFILAAYARWGERCPEHLLGDFAFALWDARRRLLFCARDHFGVKPFYYHHRPGRLFAFASEIKGLLVLSEVPRRLNETRVADYLVPLLEDKEITFYEEIVRLPPAHRLVVTREGVRIDQYWALDPEREIRMKSDAEYAAAFREIFTEAVRCRLRSAFPVGSMLSGGLDSSSIVCVARQLLAEQGRGPLHTFSAIFPELPECDERTYIDEVIAGGGLEPHLVRGDQLNPFGDLDWVLWQQDEPFYGPNLFMHWGLYRAADAAGVRVVFDGFDGDTTVSHGIAYLGELVTHGRWGRLATEIRGISRNFNVSPWGVLWRHCVRPHVTYFVRRVPRRLLRRNGLPRDAIINSEFARRVGWADHLALQRNHVESARTSKSDHWRRLGRGLTPYAFELGDKAAASFGLAGAFPFYDKRLVEVCLALPAEQKLHGGWTRVVMRRAMAQRVPDKVRWRGGKADLSPMLTRALWQFDRPLLEAAAAASNGIGHYVDVPALRRAHDRYASHPQPKDALTLWQAVILTAWLERAGLGQ